MGYMCGGGVEATVQNYFRAMDKTSLQFDFLVDEASPIVPEAEISRLGGRIIKVPGYKNVFQYLKALDKIFRSERYTIVHSHLNTLSVLPLYAARRAGIPVRIAHSHSTTSPGEPFRNLIKHALRPGAKLHPTHLAACSRDAGEWLFGEDAFASNKSLHVRNAIELKKFAFDPNARLAVRKALGISDDKFVIGQVGRLVKTKNQRFSLELFRSIAERIPEAVLLFVGDGPDEKMLQSLVQAWGLNEQVKFLGFQSNVASYYQGMDALLFPSLYEGLGLSLIEAQAAGLPCVIADTIPDEAIVMHDDIAVLSLAAPKEDWLGAIEKTRGHPRRAPVNELKVAGYDIWTNAELLRAWYFSLSGN